MEGEGIWWDDDHLDASALVAAVGALPHLAALDRTFILFSQAKRSCSLSCFVFEAVSKVLKPNHNRHEIEACYAAQISNKPLGVDSAVTLE